MSTTVPAFNVLETTIDDIHNAYKSGQLRGRGSSGWAPTRLDRL